MNRRKVIYSYFLIGGGVGLTYLGIKIHDRFKTPNINFLDDNIVLISELSDVIIPRTNTPGAKDLHAEEMIIHLLKNCSNRVTQNIFILGLNDLIDFTFKKYNKQFTDLNSEQQFFVVNYFQVEGKNFPGIVGKLKNRIWGKSFFKILKEYTTISYCTSQNGATIALEYINIPGNYMSCIKMNFNKRSWATK